MSLKLPFKIELNAPFSKVLKGQQETFEVERYLISALNRIYKQKLRCAFIAFKTQQLQSPTAYFKLLVSSAKTSSKPNKISYPTYNPAQLTNQTPVPKTPIFNLRVKSIKCQAFLKLKQFFLDVRSYQVSTVLENRQSQLLNHLIPKIQEKVYILAFRAIMDYGRARKGKSKIVTLLDKFQKNIVKRAYFSDFFNKIKLYKSRENNQKLSCQKISKILKLNERYSTQSAFRKIQLYQKFLTLQSKLAQKKQRISKIHDINSQRTVLIQKERQYLRNLKYKLDQQSIEKNHILTEKRRSLMLAKAKFLEQSRQLTDQILTHSAEVYKLSTICQKQSHIISTLQSQRSHLQQLKKRGIDFESITLSIYKVIHDLGQQGLEGFCQLVRYHQQKYNHVENMLLFDSQANTRDYLCRKITFLQKIIRTYQRRQSNTELAASRFKPLASTLSSASRMKLSPSATSSLKGSRVIVNGSYIARGKPIVDPVELVRLREEYITLQSFISLILSKSYEIKIKEAIAAQIQQLSQLLASDLKENQQ